MPLNVAVVGAGIGGPAIGATLARNGHKVTIYERAQSTTVVGYAFRITPNSDRCLKYLDIDTVAGGAAQANTARQHDQDGNINMEFGENKDADQVKKGVSVFASRPQLAKQLIERAESLGVVVKTGVKVRSVDVEKTTLILEDDTVVSADLIVGADGIHSAVRSHVVDTSIYKPQPTLNQNAFRFMIPRSAIQEDEVLSKTFTDEFRMVNWAGEQKRILTYPVDFDKHYSVVCTHPAELSNKAVQQNDSDSTGAAAVAYNQKVSLEAVHEIYSEFEPRLHRLFDKADPDGFRIWKLQDIEELPRWSVKQTVLIGDAAHAVLPFGFSGASMTIEDAVVLDEVLPSEVKIEDIPARLQAYEQLRKPRLQHIKETAVKIGRDEIDGKDIGAYFKFLGQYDAVEVGRQALKDALAQ